MSKIALVVGAHPDHPHLLRAHRRWLNGRPFYEYFRHIRVDP